MKKRIIFVLLILVFLIIPSLSSLSSMSSEIKEKKIYVSNKIYEKIERGSIKVIIDAEENTNLVNSLNKEKIKINYISKTRNFVSATIDKNKLDILKKNLDIKSISYEPEVKLFLQESVPLINAITVWNLKINETNLTGEGETICIIDTGVNYNHPDLGGCLGSGCKILAGYAYINPTEPANPNNPMDDHGHGTHVVGIAAANGSIMGVSPNANIVAIKACGPDSSCNWSAIIDGINWCVDNSSLFNISVISMSFGTVSLHDSYCDSEYSDITIAINEAIAKNISVIAAVGNDGNTTAIASPACIENVTAVGATDKSDNIASYSNRNSITDLLAPGGTSSPYSSRINSTSKSGGYVGMFGTSMSTPHVAGAFALIRQFKRLEKEQILKPFEIKNALKETGKLIPDSASELNFSRINIYSAILSLDETAPSISLIQPQNNLATIEKNLTFSCNVTDLQLKNITIKIWDSSGLYYNNSENISGTFSQQDWNLTNISYDNYEWNCRACDEKNYCGVSENFSLTIEDNYFIVRLLSPLDKNYINQSEQNFTCNITSLNELTNVTFFLWDLTDLVHGKIRNIGGLENETIFNYSFLEQGSYEWNCLASNNVGNSSFAQSNFTITYDSIAPNITLFSPENNTNYVSNSQEIIFSYNVTENATCSLIINNIIQPGFTQTFSPGTYMWQINCTDKAGNWGNSSQRTFIITASEDPSGGTSESSGGGGGGITPTNVNNVSESVSVSCVESWTCGNWGECINGTQARECIDDNYCGTTENKPQSERECEQEKETGAVPLTGAIIREIRENISWIGAVLIILFVLIIAFKIRGFKIKKNRKGRYGKI